MSEYQIPPDLQGAYQRAVDFRSNSMNEPAAAYAPAGTVILLIERIARLESENGHQRVALLDIETIANDQYPVSIGNQWAWSTVARVARAALAQKETKC